MDMEELITQPQDEPLARALLATRLVELQVRADADGRSVLPEKRG